MPSTTYTLRQASPVKTRSDVVVAGVLKTDKGPVLASGGEELAAAFGKSWAGLLSSLSVTGKAGEVTRIPGGDAIGAQLLVLVGLGEKADTEALRRAAGAAARAVTNATSVALALPAEAPEEAAAVLQGWILGGYTFTDYKSVSKSGSKKKDEAPGTVAVLSATAKQNATVAAFEAARHLAEATGTVRDWVNTPGGDLTPPAFADAVTAAVTALEADAPRSGKGRKGEPLVTVTVWDEKDLADLGCGGILAVGSASAAQPRMVKLEYTPADAVAHVALVGKGVTFDTGGLTIKPGANMHEMKSDMAGAATVVAATLLLARAGVPVRVTTFAPMAENALGGSAYRPGDVLTMRNGSTVEVRNTDAEGRLLLADALAMAVEAEPDVVLDVATLTGHMVLALGSKVTGVLGSDDVVQEVLAASRRVDEQMWPMPITDEMTGRVRSSKIADLLQHDWVRWGGGLYAAAFLQEFTGSLPWAHLDIAGPAYNSGSASGHLTPGGTGVALATLVAYVEDLATRTKP